MSFGFTGLFHVVVNSNLNIYDVDQFYYIASDVQHNGECHFVHVVVNTNKVFNNINNNTNNPSTTHLRANDTIESTTSYSNKLLYDNVQIIITFGSIGITFILFTIIFINRNCVFMVNSQSHYNFIDLGIFIVSLCMILIGLVLVYFIQSDKIIDTIYIECQNYYFNEQSTGQSLQVNIGDHIVNNWVICWYNCILFIMIVMVYVNAIYSFDAIIDYLCILHCSNDFVIQLVTSFNQLLLFFIMS